MAKGVKKGEKYTHVTDEMRTEIKAAIAREGGLRQAAQVWGKEERSIYRVIYESKFVSMTWLDDFCCVAITTMWLNDFEWHTYAELKDLGDWKANRKFPHLVKHEEGRKCRVCDKVITKENRRIYCSDECMRFYNRRLRPRKETPKLTQEAVSDKL